MSKRAIKDECAVLKEKVKTLQKAAGKVPVLTKKRKEADAKVKAAKQELRTCKAARRDIPALILLKATLRAREDVGLAKNTGWKDIPLKALTDKQEQQYAKLVGATNLAQAVTVMQKKNREQGIEGAVALASAEMFAKKARTERTVGIVVAVLVVAAVVIVVILTAGAAAPVAAAGAGAAGGGAGAGGAGAGAGAAATGTGVAVKGGAAAAGAGGTAATAAEGAAKAGGGLFKRKAVSAASDAVAQTDEANQIITETGEVLKQGGRGDPSKLAALALKAEKAYTKVVKSLRSPGAGGEVSTYEPSSAESTSSEDLAQVDDDEEAWYQNPLVLGGAAVGVTGLGLLIWRLSSTPRTT